MTTTHPQWLLGIMMFLAALPLLVTCCTCYLKVSVVINLLKGGLGFNSGGTMAIEFALSASLVAIVMHPIVVQSAKNLDNVPPLALDKAPQLRDLSALQPAIEPWRAFLAKQVGTAELSAMREIAMTRHTEQSSTSNSSSPDTSDRKESAVQEPPLGSPIPLRVLFAAFVVSELRGAIVIGVMILIPFLLVDLIIANTLTALGLTMVSPISIALPIKLLLFYACDGWILISRTIFYSYL